MKDSNTITASQNIEVYENKIWLLVDEYINTVLCIHQEDYDSIEKYKKDIANNRIDMFFYIADRIEKPSNNDIELLDSIFNIYIRVCGRYGISPTLQMFVVFSATAPFSVLVNLLSSFIAFAKFMFFSFQDTKNKINYKIFA